MTIKVLVSCDSERTDFIKCIKTICDESKEELECHFIPNEPAPIKEPDRLNRMLSLVGESNIIFMDLTPKLFPLNEKEVYLTNPGVLIEYGVLAASAHYYERLYLFCEDTVSRSLLHPYFIKTVQPYSRDKLNDKKASCSLRRQVKDIINDYKNRLPEMVRKLQEENEAYEAYTKVLKKR